MFASARYVLPNANGAIVWPMAWDAHVEFDHLLPGNGDTLRKTARGIERSVRRSWSNEALSSDMWEAHTAEHCLSTYFRQAGARQQVAIRNIPTIDITDLRLSLGEEVDSTLVTCPTWFAVTNRLVVSMRIGLRGINEYVGELMVWRSRRHEASSAPSPVAQRAGERAATRLYFAGHKVIAMFWASLGYFGSRKVDARNNP